MTMTPERELEIQKYSVSGDNPELMGEYIRELLAALDRLRVEKDAEIDELQRDLDAAREAANKKPSFVGYEGNPDDLLDPKYKQSDDAQRTRDAYAWLEQNFRRVVHDTPDGTTIDFSRAKTKPPTVFAVQVLEEFARAEPGSQRRLTLSTKIHEAISKSAAAAKDVQNKKQKKPGIGYVGDM